MARFLSSTSRKRSASGQGNEARTPFEENSRTDLTAFQGKTRTHVRRKVRPETYSGEGSQIRRPPFHRSEGQVAARHFRSVSDQRRRVHPRADVRRLVHC